MVADLEDAVAPAEKPVAREVVARLAPPIVRVNGTGTPWFEDDLALVGAMALDAIVMPKATPEAVAALGAEGPPVIAIVETAQGLRLAYETASTPRVVALILGAVDLGAELGLEPRADGLEILHARSKVVIDSTAAGIRPPFDRVHLDVHDDGGLEAECLFARSLGFRGKACIHPQQVPIVNRVLVAERHRGRLGAEGGRGVRDRARRRPWRLRPERSDDRPPRRRAGTASPGRGRKEQRMSTNARQRHGAAGSTRTSRSATSSRAGSGERSPRRTTSGSPASRSTRTRSTSTCPTPSARSSASRS